MGLAVMRHQLAAHTVTLIAIATPLSLSDM